MLYRSTTGRSFPFLLCGAFLLLLPTMGFAPPPGVNSVQNGDWSVNSTWDGNAPGCSINQDVVISAGDTVTCACDPLDIKGTGSITIEDGGHLIVESNTGVTGSGDLTVNSGGSILVKGDLDISGNGNFQNDGDAVVQGNFDRSGSGTADGSGDLTIGGCCCSPDWQGNSSNCNAGVPLPVELVSFEGRAEKQGVRLRWMTASEQNCSHFIVQERSKTGFERIAQVEGSGTSVGPTRYTILDEEAEAGATNYYRLVQVDLDGERTLYGPVAVRRSGNGNGELKVFPNPLEETATLEFPNSLLGDGSLLVRDMTGRVLFQKKLLLSQDARVTLDRSSIGLPSGTYLLTLRSA